jgi:TPR repeat protein
VQFKLGDSYCCHGGGPMDSMSVYDNDKATYWYCRSAKQGYAPAQIRLANVYSGHPIHGLHVALRASALVGDVDTDLGVGLLWASVAASHGDEDGRALRDKIAEQASDKERARAAELMKNWRNAPCQWGEVFPQAKASR